MTAPQIDLSTLAQGYIDELDEAGASPATIRLYEKTFNQLAKHRVTLEHFNSPELINFVASLAPTDWKRSTLTAHLTRVASFSNWLFRRGYTTHRHQAPRHSRRPKLRDMPTDEEVGRLLSALATRSSSATPGRLRTRKQDELITRLLVETGARISEVLSLAVDDVLRDQEGARVLIRGTKSEAAERAVAISISLAEELRRYRAQFHIARGRLFRSKSRKPLAPNEFGRWLKAYCVELGIHCVITPHVFRHRWILEQIKQGKSALEVMTRVGHEDVTMTVYYFNQVRRLMPFVEVNGDIALLERRQRFWRSQR